MGEFVAFQPNAFLITVVTSAFIVVFSLFFVYRVFSDREKKKNLCPIKSWTKCEWSECALSEGSLSFDRRPSFLQKEKSLADSYSLLLLIHFVFHHRILILIRHQTCCYTISTSKPATGTFVLCKIASLAAAAVIIVPSLVSHWHHSVVLVSGICFWGTGSSKRDDAEMADRRRLQGEFLFCLVWIRLTGWLQERLKGVIRKLWKEWNSLRTSGKRHTMLPTRIRRRSMRLISRRKSKSCR